MFFCAIFLIDAHAVVFEERKVVTPDAFPFSRAEVLAFRDCVLVDGSAGMVTKISSINLNTRAGRKTADQALSYVLQAARRKFPRLLAKATRSELAAMLRSWWLNGRCGEVRDYPAHIRRPLMVRLILFRMQSSKSTLKVLANS